MDATTPPSQGSTLADMASEVYANRMGWPSFVAVTAPPLLLAGLGLTHPNDLSGASAGWWTSLHIILVPLFPLLGLSHWVLLHRRPGVIAWIGRVAAFLYIAFYAVTDHIAGIGTGVVMQQSGASSTSERPEIGWLFGVANDVGGAGFGVGGGRDRSGGSSRRAVSACCPAACSWSHRAGTSRSPEFTSTGRAESSRCR
jgi:hypothetical protein